MNKLRYGCLFLICVCYFYSFEILLYSVYHMRKQGKLRKQGKQGKQGNRENREDRGYLNGAQEKYGEMDGKLMEIKHNTETKVTIQGI